MKILNFIVRHQYAYKASSVYKKYTNNALLFVYFLYTDEAFDIILFNPKTEKSKISLKTT